MSSGAMKSNYDVIIIGAGIGGLTCGALLAQEGMQVLVVEKDQAPGGFAQDFKYGAYTLNPALHAIMGCNPDGPLGQGIVDGVLNHLGVQDSCEFISVNPFYRVEFPEIRLDVPTGREEFLEAHISHFPQHANGLRSIIDLSSKIYREFMEFPSVQRWQDLLLMPIRYPNIFRNVNTTVASVMDRFQFDPLLKSVYAILYPYLALPPSRLSFILWAIMMADYIEGGAYYCKGGFQNFANSLAEGLINNGGELVVSSQVTGINTAGSIVQGVKLENGQSITANQVVPNIDPRTTFRDLMSTDQFNQNYLHKMDGMEVSDSVLSLSLATDIDIHSLGIPKLTLVMDQDLEAGYRATTHGNIKGMAIHVPSVIDPTLAPPGEFIVILQAFAPVNSVELTSEFKAQTSTRLLEWGEKVIPGLQNRITFVPHGAESDDQEFPITQLGPIYGWANSTSQSGPRRLPPTTPVKGLYLTGHWTQPGSGIWTVVLSGILTARLILGKITSEPIWPFR
jgi:prolycopene isomerase